MLRFIFSFLYTRNWVTGQMELSRSRLFIFVAMTLLITLIVILAIIMQLPVAYTALSYDSL